MHVVILLSADILCSMVMDTVRNILIFYTLVNFFWELVRKPDEFVLYTNFIYSRSALSSCIQQLRDLPFLPYEGINYNDIYHLWRCFIPQKSASMNPYKIPYKNQHFNLTTMC